MNKKILYSEYVNEFLQSLDEKAKAKILYNISLVANGKIDKELFPNWMMKYGNSGLTMEVFGIGY